MSRVSSSARIRARKVGGRVLQSPEKASETRAGQGRGGARRGASTGPTQGESCTSKLGACILFQEWGIVSRKPIMSKKEDQLRWSAVSSGVIVVTLSKMVAESVGLAAKLDMRKKEREIKDNAWFL